MIKSTFSVALKLILTCAITLCQLAPPALADDKQIFLQVAGHTDSSISLSWSDNFSSESVTDYIVEYRRSDAANWLVEPRISGTETSATIYLLQKGVIYSFRVTPVFTNILGSSSNVVSEMPSSVPEYPKHTEITNLPSGGFVLNWNKPYSGGSPITSYDIYYSSDGLEYSLVENLPSLGLLSYTYEVPKPSGAQLGDPAFFRVLAKNRDGTLNPSDWAPFDYEKPKASWNRGDLNATFHNCYVTILRGANCDGHSIGTESWKGTIVSFLRGSNPLFGSSLEYHCYLTSIAMRQCQVPNSKGGFTQTLLDENPYPFLAGIVKYPVEAPNISIISHGDKVISVAIDKGQVSSDDINSVECAYSHDDLNTIRRSYGNWPAVAVRVSTNGSPYKIQCRLLTGYASSWSNVVTEYSSTVPTAPTLMLTRLSSTSIEGLVDIGSADYLSGGSNSSLNSLQYSVDGLRWFELTNRQDNLDGTYSFFLNDLSGDRKYRFKANLLNRDGTGGWSNEVSVIPNSATLPAEPKIRILSHTNSSVEVSWSLTDNGGVAITQHLLQYSSDNGLTWMTFNSKFVGSDSTFVTGLDGERLYAFRVAAINPVGQGAFSPAAFETTSKVPEVMQLQAASKSDTSVKLEWNGLANGWPISNYVVEYRQINEEVWIRYSDGSDADSNTLITGLKTGIVYEFQVTAVNRDGQGPPSIIYEKPSSIPLVNYLKASKLTETSIALTWVATDNGDAITHLLVEYSSDRGENWMTYSNVLPYESASTTVSGLAMNKEYRFRISASNREGWSMPSDIVIVDTFNAPSTPNLRVDSHSSNSISLSWTTPDNGGTQISGYVLQYGKASSDTWTSLYDSGFVANFYRVSSLMPGQNYRFRVAVSNVVGQSKYSEIVFEKTSGPPSMASLSSSSSTDSSVSLIWGVGNRNGDQIMDYKVEYSPNGGLSWVTFADGESTKTSTMVTGLARGTSYLFRVSAENRDGFGKPTAIISASTSPSTQPKSAKVNISGQSKSGSTLSVSVAGSLAGSSFKYEWLLDGKKIVGRSSKIAISKTFIGQKLIARVTISNLGYWPLTLTSSTATIKK